MSQDLIELRSRATSLSHIHPLRFEQVRIENTNRCGYKCFFCPREKLARKQGFMPVEDFLLVLDRVGNHTGRVDLHGFGEPLLDRQLGDKLAILRDRWRGSQSTIYSTLGVRMTDATVESIMANLSRLEVSFYGTTRESYRATHGADRFHLAKSNLALLAQQRRAGGSRMELLVRAFPSHDSVTQPGVTEDSLQAFMDWLAEIGVDAVRERAMHNYGGGRDYNAAGSQKPCSVVWGLRYRILQVTWNLDVIPCCFDFDAKMPFGNLRSQSLAQIFAGDAYTRFYRAHLANTLERYPVCASCERCFAP